MNAKPNQLNMLIEVPNLITNQPLFYNCGHDYEDAFYNLRFDPNSEEYCGFVAIAPKDLLAGSDVTLKLLWCGWETNATGSAKVVVWGFKTNHAYYPAVLGSATTHSELSGSIPDGEARLTLHLDTIGVITALQPGEHISAELRRKAAESADTWDSDAVTLPILIMEYISTLLKKV